MALTRFVRNVDDLSDNGGYKFRFRCDLCNDGVESQYIASSANLLKIGLEAFQMFRFFRGGLRRAPQVDLGLRGKERDAAYEKAVNMAMVHFQKCSHCGKYSCAHCWNASVGLCEGCAPDASEAAAKAAAKNRLEYQVAQVHAQGALGAPVVTCVTCGKASGGGKFCQHCGASTAPSVACKGCQAQLAPTARFCGECGTAV
jgi:hypothetical protein